MKGLSFGMDRKFTIGLKVYKQKNNTHERADDLKGTLKLGASLPTKTPFAADDEANRTAIREAACGRPCCSRQGLCAVVAKTLQPVSFQVNIN